MALVLTPWQPPPTQPELAGHAVHLWRFPLTAQESLEHLLSEPERQRARLLRIPARARAFVVARARLRQILAAYLDLAPQSVRFSYGAAGKPLLDKPSPRVPAFNLAHAGSWGLCAVASGETVGVDIERLDRQLDFEKLAAQFFSTGERCWLQDCPPRRRRRMFFRLWTRKEAWLKGKGGGFSDADQDVSALCSTPAPPSAGSWWLRNIPVDRHHLAALALPRHPACVERWSGWPPPG